MKIKANVIKTRSVATLVALAASMPILMVTSAQAATVPLGCTVTPKTPVQISDDFWTGQNRVQATAVVKCPAGTLVVLDQRVYETTPQGLTELGKATHTDVFALPGTQNDSVNANVPNTPGTEKVLQRVKVTVYDLNHPDGLQSGWIGSGSVLVT